MATNDNEDLEVNTDNDEEVEEEQHEEEEEFTPLSKEETKAIRDSLTKANAEAKKYRLEVKSLKNGAAATNEANADEDEKKLNAAKKEVEDFYRPRLVKSAVKAALKEAGLSGSPDRLLKLVEVGDFEIDENGDVDESDLDRTVESLKTDYPELFPTKRTPRIDGGREATGTKSTTKDSAAVLFDRMKGNSRR